MSDMHRSDGDSSDDFAHNSLIREGFTYIELGDAEELWNNLAIQWLTEGSDDSRIL